MAVSGFVVQVPEADRLVGTLRLRHDESARFGMPAHLTVLFPFMPPEAIDAAVRLRIERVVGAQRAFAYSLAGVGRFPATAYLAPEPAAPFVALTSALAAEFPAWPPFGGEFPTVVPHLTVAHGDAEVAAAVARQLEVLLAAHGPIRATCRTLTLVENATGRWRQLRQFWLAASPDEEPPAGPVETARGR